MINDQDSRLLMNQLSHEASVRHQCELDYIVGKSEYQLFEQLHPRLFLDGDQWCCLYGENIQEGIVGFGDTPYKAVIAMNIAFHASAKERAK